MRQQGEPSVEDILSSIKKVIARDVAPKADSTAAPARAPRVVEEEDVLELAHADRFEEDLAEDDAPALMGVDARDSLRESLAALAMMATPRAAPQIVRSGETSMEDLVRDALRPALAEWLDKNLPPMVERMVGEEIARIVGKKA